MRNTKMAAKGTNEMTVQCKQPIAIAHIGIPILFKAEKTKAGTAIASVINMNSPQG